MLHRRRPVPQVVWWWWLVVPSGGWWCPKTGDWRSCDGPMTVHGWVIKGPGQPWDKSCASFTGPQSQRMYAATVGSVPPASGAIIATLPECLCVPCRRCQSPSTR